VKSQRRPREAVVYRGSGRKIDERGARPVYRETGMPVLGSVDFNYSLESWHTGTHAT